MATYIIRIDERNKRGKALAQFLLTLGAIKEDEYDGKPTDGYENPSPSGDPFFARKDTMEQINKSLAEVRAGKYKVITNVKDFLGV
ncbi:MAG: hypothetical protein SOY07_08855 [Bacteroidales bacterium]|nr:hypothetical protein [Bacteroidales bacterium]